MNERITEMLQENLKWRELNPSLKWSELHHVTLWYNGELCADSYGDIMVTPDKSLSIEIYNSIA